MLSTEDENARGPLAQRQTPTTAAARESRLNEQSISELRQGHTAIGKRCWCLLNMRR